MGNPEIIDRRTSMPNGEWLACASMGMNGQGQVIIHTDGQTRGLFCALHAFSRFTFHFSFRVRTTFSRRRPSCSG